MLWQAYRNLFMAKEDELTFSEYLEANRQCLIGHFLVSQISNGEYTLPDPWPPEALSDEDMEALTDSLNACIPVNSWITDLWDWDIHFERALEYDWYFEAVFGEAAIQPCADELADFFLEKVEEFDMDYDQHTSPEIFEALVRDEAYKFIVQWRTNIAHRFSVSGNLL